MESVNANICIFFISIQYTFQRVRLTAQHMTRLPGPVLTTCPVNMCQDVSSAMLTNMINVTSKQLQMSIIPSILITFYSLFVMISPLDRYSLGTVTENHAS